MHDIAKPYTTASTRPTAPSAPIGHVVVQLCSFQQELKSRDGLILQQFPAVIAPKSLLDLSGKLPCFRKHLVFPENLSRPFLGVVDPA